jgi:prepilin-type N-terminal cleavage/methylation domain-containing protein
MVYNLTPRHKRNAFASSSCRGKAFTLIELLAVIAVVAILAAILIPAVNSVRARSLETHDAQNLRSIHAAAMLFVADNSGKLPSVLVPNADSGAWENLWVDQIEPYMPAAADRTTTKEGRNPAFYSPNVPVENRWVADYAANDNLMRSGVQSPAVAVKDPAKELLLFEGAKNRDKLTPRNSGAFKAWAKELANGSFDWPNTVARRHGSKSDPVFFGVYVSGEVERFHLNDLAADDERRRTLFSARSNGNSIYTDN